MNLKDNLRQNDASATPLEFIYEAADCRMFFTAAMVTDPTELWKGVADRMFKGAAGMEQCVQGSTGDASSVSAGGQKRAGDGTLAEGKGVEGTQRSVASGGAAVSGGVAGRVMGKWVCVGIAVVVGLVMV